jgi:ParB/RepB/Spo0J family partition protein
MSEFKSEVIAYEDLQLEGAGFVNPRNKTGLDKASLLALSAAIEEGGLMYPLIVHRLTKDDETINVVVGGQRRYKAIGLLLDADKGKAFKDGIPCNVREGETTPLDAEIDALMDGVQREDLSSFEQAEAMANLKTRGMAQKDIATRLKKSPAWVSRFLTAHEKAAPPLVRAWREGKLPADTVLDLATLPAEEQEAAVTEQLSDRSDGGKRGAAKGRKKAKAKAAKAKGKPAKDESAWLSRADIRDFADKMKATPKEAKYAQGFRDGLMFMMGEIGVAEIGKEVVAVLKEYEKAKAAAAKAKPAKDENEGEGEDE